MTKISKRIAKAYEGIDRTKTYPVLDAVKLVKGRAAVKFDETVELAMTLGVDPRHADQAVRGMVSLPSGTGKKLRIAVFAKGDKADPCAGARNAFARFARCLRERVEPRFRRFHEADVEPRMTAPQNARGIFERVPI